MILCHIRLLAVPSICYSPEHNGFYLKNHGWDLQAPLFEENMLLAAVLGARFAEDVAPYPLKTKIRDGVSGILSSNNPDFLDTAYINSIMIASGLNVSISPEVFHTVFEAWVKHRCLKIKYNDSQCKATERIIEPHALVYLDSAWFIRGICHIRNAKRTFAIHRILEAAMIESSFSPESDVIDGVRGGVLFDYKPVKDVQLECNESIIHLIQERPLHSSQKIKKSKQGMYVVSIPNASEYALLKWLFSQQGQARLLSPHDIRKKIVAISQEILKKHQ